MSFRLWARKLTLDMDREAAVDGFVPCGKYEIGKFYMYCPDGKRPCKVKLVDGQYWGTYGLSNHWRWRRVLKNGKLGKVEFGYGGAFKHVKKAKKGRACRKAKRRSRS